MTVFYNLDGSHKGFAVIDDADGKPVEQWAWIDDVAMQCACYSAWSVWGGGAIQIARVTRVAVNYASREIHVNEPPLIAASSGIVVRELHACRDCQQPETCRRIDVCVAHKTAFGEAREP